MLAPKSNIFSIGTALLVSLTDLIMERENSWWSLYEPSCKIEQQLKKEKIEYVRSICPYIQTAMGKAIEDKDGL